MGSSSPLGSKSSSSDNSASYENALSNLAGMETGYGTDINTAGLGQYYAGATGSLTPAQEALVTQSLGNMNLGTMANYANLGLGGSTMEQQDLNANQLSSLSQQAGLEAQSEELGLQALGTGLSYLNAGGGSLGSAYNINNQSTQNQASALSSLASGLGGKSGSSTGTSGAGSSSTSGLGGLLGNLFSGSGSSSSEIGFNEGDASIC